jgi:hypothetical protein
MTAMVWMLRMNRILWFYSVGKPPTERVKSTLQVQILRFQPLVFQPYLLHVINRYDRKEKEKKSGWEVHENRGDSD